MLIFLPNSHGYSEFTSYIHRNTLTGIIHGIGLPISAIGLFTLIYTLVHIAIRNRLHSKIYTICVASFILGGYTVGYITYDPYWGLITILFYSWLIFRTIDKVYTDALTVDSILTHTKTQMFKGLIYLFVPVLFMEFLGHWILEGKGSDVSQLLNSIYHTPLYGIKALFEPIFKLVA